MKLFTIYDSKAEAYLPPITFRTTAEAIRGFIQTVKDPSSQFHKHPADYTLYELGEYNQLSALITTYPSPRPLSNAAEHTSNTPPPVPNEHNDF